MQILPHYFIGILKNTLDSIFFLVMHREIQCRTLPSYIGMPIAVYDGAPVDTGRTSMLLQGVV
ncbi:MAG: hypothetical protein HHJ09_04670 [Glaciimonas sp.]|nr:hypothetical protein [Glaciimonas sp.]